ncbi:MAG: serine protein kinase PrkA, partial [Myxococcota bacterium]|nr:serine protein kinase PrkA [Myxococcota bacterium]
GSVLESLSDQIQTKFKSDKTILSYYEWFDLVLEKPRENLRSSSQYIRDVFEYYGRTELNRPQGTQTRFNLFDSPWDNGKGRVAGQEQVQQEIYRLISNFIKDGKVSKLILLHGPNGSAKSTLVRCIQSAMEQYSRTADGAVYTYAWIFPSEKISKGSLGFGSNSSDSGSSHSSFAHIGSEQIDARLPCELCEHPIFLLPREQRQNLIEKLFEQGKLNKEFIPSRYILEGELSPRDRAIYEALLVSYDGDHSKVLKHIQVQRIAMSVSYSKGVATIEPQMAVDAASQQLTTDRSIANLPRSLHHIPLHQLGGPLVKANRGLLEFSDFLKRPLEALKYLLTTSEEATVSLPDFKIQIDELLIASTNETYLEAFKKNPDWNSFKGRMELVSVPYLLRFSDEIEIYRQQIGKEKFEKPMAPHVVEIAAMWATLTRLKKPNAGDSAFSESVRELAKKLSPLEKLHLYDSGRTPKWCTTQESKELSYTIPLLYNETATELEYEGHRGASAREIRTLILNAAHIEDLKTLTPQAVLIEIEKLVSDASVYDFLQDKTDNGYSDHKSFIEVVRNHWLNLLDEEFKASMGLVEESRYFDLFSRYVQNVSQHLKGEKIFDEIIDDYVDPDQQLMSEVESSILPEKEDKDEFRKAIISKIGAWSLEHPGEAPDYQSLFSHFIEQMEAEYYTDRKKLIEKRLENIISYLGDTANELSADEYSTAQSAIERMEKEFGYPKLCTAECAMYILRHRYQ